MRMDTAEKTGKHKEIPPRFSELYEATVDPTGRSAAGAPMLDWRITSYLWTPL